MSKKEWAGVIYFKVVCYTFFSPPELNNAWQLVGVIFTNAVQGIVPGKTDVPGLDVY